MHKPWLEFQKIACTVGRPKKSKQIVSNYGSVKERAFLGPIFVKNGLNSL